MNFKDITNNYDITVNSIWHFDWQVMKVKNTSNKTIVHYKYNGNLYIIVYNCKDYKDILKPNFRLIDKILVSKDYYINNN